MKLLKFDRTTCANSRAANALPTISFNAKGLISLNEGALKLCGLAPGDTFSISQDEDEPENWYLCKDKDGFTLRAFGAGSKSAAANNIGLVRIIFKAVGKRQEGVLKMLLAGKPTMVGKVAYHGILMNSAKLSERGSK